MSVLLYYTIILDICVFLFAVIFFYVYRRTREKYLSHWSASWAVYGFGVALQFSLDQRFPSALMVAAQQIILSVSALLLLAGTFRFLSRTMSRRWLYLFSVSVLLFLLFTGLDLPYSITAAPLSAFYGVVSVYTGIVLLQTWPLEGAEKNIVGVAFIVWGIHKAYYSYLYPNFSAVAYQYALEMVLLVVLNMALFFCYLQKNHSQVVRNEKIFRLLMENSKDIIYLFHMRPEPFYEYISSNVAEVLGYEPEEFYRNPYLLYETVHPADKGLFDLTLTPNLSPNSAVTLRYRHKQGHYLWFEEYTSLLYDDSGEPFGLEGCLRDITDTKRFQDQLQTTETEKQEFLHKISHELKTPITAIRGNLDVILDHKVPPGENIEKYLLNARDKARLLERLTLDLFELSQMESKRFSFHFSMLSFDEFFPELFAKLSDEALGLGLLFSTETDPTLSEKEIQLIIDTQRIEQVFYNLFFNAVNHTPPGGQITIACALQPDETSLEFRVSDTGSGIAEKDLPHVFDTFYKAPGTPSRGAGLGLAISREILAGHGAEIRVESCLGKGSSFIITYPLQQN